MLAHIFEKNKNNSVGTRIEDKSLLTIKQLYAGIILV